jgi:hypothetical protein
MRFITIGYRISAGLGLPATVQAPDPTTSLETPAAAEAEVSVKREQVLMLGSPEAIIAAQEWRDEAWHLEWFARGRRGDTPEFVKATCSSRD